MDLDDEILLAFLEESNEGLDALDSDVVNLEHGADPEIMNRIFRTVHTIKGTSGFLGFPNLEALTHAGETLLDSIREGAIELTPDITTSLLGLFDAIRAVLGQVAADGTEGTATHTDVIADLARHLVDAAVLAEPDAIVPEQSPMSEPLAGADAVSDEPADDDHEHADDWLPHLATGKAAHEGTVRVGVEVLDDLMALMSELVVTRSQFAPLASDEVDDALSDAYSRLDLLTRELQDKVMEARLQPIGTVTSKFRRVARDLAASLGKMVRVEIDGETVAVDRAVNEALRDPLLHLVRNAVDHGIETPSQRERQGKSQVGEIRINATHDHGRVHLEVADDGGGIDTAQLLNTAIADGMITPAQAATMNRQTALDLVFEPGFSTAAEVTSVSGRGVGMDVVRSNLQQIGGTIDVESELRVGTIFRINVPLTLAIMPSLTVFCDGERYAIPQASIEEVFSLAGEEAAAMRTEIDGTPIYRLRGHLVPAVDLRDALGLQQPELTDSEREQNSGLLIILETDKRRFGLVVPAIGDSAEVVIKPLPSALAGIVVLSGVTIMGDGLPSLILDVPGIADWAGLTAIAETDHGHAEPVQEQISDAGIVLASAIDGGQLAVKLASVRRLEHFEPGQIERVGDREVVRYGDEILPLLHVSRALPERRAQPRGEAAAADVVPTVVCETEAGPVGLVVGRIEGVVPEPAAASQPASRRGVQACLVVDDRIAELLDVETLAADAGIVRRQS